MHGKNGGGIPPVTNKLYMGRMVAMDFLSHCIYNPQNWSQIMVHKFYNIFAIIWVGPTNNLC